MQEWRAQSSAPSSRASGASAERLKPPPSRTPTLRTPAPGGLLLCVPELDSRRSPAPAVAPLPRSAWRRVRLALLVELFDATGGKERSSRLLAAELARAGARVTVLTTVFSETSDLAPRVERVSPELTIVRFPWPTGWHYTLAELSFYARAGLWLLRHASSWREIHGVSAATCGSLAVLLGRLLGRRSVVRLACSGPPGDMAHVARHPARRLVASLLGSASAVACPSQEIAREVLAAAPRARVRWVPNGVDASLFHPLEAGSPAPDASPVVLAVVRFRPEKNVPRLLDAWALVEKAHPGARLWLAGDGDELPRAKDRAFHLGLARVEFLGTRKDVPELLRKATLFVHASDAEGLSNALLEAMASGLPCVATAIEANREALGDTGLLVEGEPRAIAQGLLDLLNDPGKARALGSAARTRVLGELGLEGMVGRYAGIYLENQERNKASPLPAPRRSAGEGTALFRSLALFAIHRTQGLPRGHDGYRRAWKQRSGRGTLAPMRAFMLDAPEELLAERRRKGHDHFDETWEGVLHMVPAPSSWHQEFGTELVAVLLPVAKSLGLRASYETDVYRPNAPVLDYRQPDIVVSKPEYRTKRGVEGPCEFAVEILSPNDETYEKLPFYGEIGVRELLVVDPETRAIQLYILAGKQLLPLTTDASGSLRSQILGVTFTTVAGPKLKVTWPGGETEF